MTEHATSRPRALLGALTVCVLLLAGHAPAAAAPADCGGGDLRLLQGEDIATVVGVRVTGIGPACDGQPVGVQFLGNPQGDPALPATELARAHSDVDPCTGDDVPSGVLQDGAVEVLLCEGSTTSGHVDGEQLTRLRLLTTAGTADTPVPGAPPAPGGADAPDGAPGVPREDLPVTGAAILRALLLGAALVLGGTMLVRTGRRGVLLRR